VVKMNVVFLGTPDFAVPTLRALLQSDRYDVCAVFTQPDRPSGRGHRVQPPPVKVLASAHGIPVFQPPKIRAEENRPLFEQFHAEYIVVAAFGQILPVWLLNSAKIAPVNVHASLLPRHRGAAPIAWAILKGDTVTGITTMLMDEHLDTGPMLLKGEVPIPITISAGDLESGLAELGARLLLETLDGLQAGRIEPTQQDERAATLAPRIKKEMAALSWNAPADQIHNAVRAFNPWPLAYVSFRGQRLQVLRTMPEPDQTAAEIGPGTCLGMTQSGLRVQCGGRTVLDVLEVQLPGKRPVSGREFAAGARLKSGVDRLC
jgi:methionyl-tRNA formyltransferase